MTQSKFSRCDVGEKTWLIVCNPFVNRAGYDHIVLDYPEIGMSLTAFFRADRFSELQPC